MVTMKEGAEEGSGESWYLAAGVIGLLALLLFSFLAFGLEPSVPSTAALQLSVQEEGKKVSYAGEARKELLFSSQPTTLLFSPLENGEEKPILCQVNCEIQEK